MISTWNDTARSARKMVRPPEQGLDYLAYRLKGRMRQWGVTSRRLMAAGKRCAQLFDDLEDKVLQDKIDIAREKIARRPDVLAHKMEALAAVGRVIHRVQGMRPYPNQYAAALALLDERMVELATGQGKSLVAVLASIVASWHHTSVHVLTSNDYLAKRDGDACRPIARLCGVEVGIVTDDQMGEDRSNAYLCRIVFSTQKNVAGDLLRDMLENKKGPNLDWVIVDEADALMIDDATTPLIISGAEGTPEREEAIAYACKIRPQFVEGKDYKIDAIARQITLTAEGRRKSIELGEACDLPLWHVPCACEELAEQALNAHHFFLRDQHYFVDDDKVIIVDAQTGRPQPDRNWRDGLHQAVEAKEGVPIQPIKPTMADVSFQHFFSMYRHLSAMTGTCWDSRKELWDVYSRLCVRIPSHQPLLRKDRRWVLTSGDKRKYDLLQKWIHKAHAIDRPVLVGTRTIQESEHIAALLENDGLSHVVLNARQDAQEAEIVAQAGCHGAITIATNMAGRGTDIRLDEAARAAGGLLVVVTQVNASKRIDRQLYGRGGRQGDPGGSSSVASLEDEVIASFLGPKVAAVLKCIIGPHLTVLLAQWLADRNGIHSRRQSYLSRQQWHRMLSFTNQTFDGK